MFSSGYLLFKSYIFYTDNLPFTHIFCRKHINRRKNRTVHKDMESPERPVYSCAVCNQTFCSKFSLKRHKTRHTDASFECLKCDKVFRSNYALSQHQRAHAEPKHVCSQCGKAYKSKQWLVLHERKEHKEQPKAMCGVCHKTFHTESHLREHMLKHVGAKSFSCPKCTRLYRYPASFRRHICRPPELAGKAYNCSVCQKSFQRSRYLMTCFLNINIDLVCISDCRL